MHLETEWEWRLRDVEPLEEQQQPLSAEFINDLPHRDRACAVCTPA